MGNAASGHTLQNDGIQSEINLCYTQEYLRRPTDERKKRNISVLGRWSGGKNDLDCSVLPIPSENVKLRATTNGAILQAGGTISFRAKELTDRNKSTKFLPMRRCHTLILDGQNDMVSKRQSAPAVTEFRRSQTLILVGNNKRKIQENLNLKTADYQPQSSGQTSTSTLATLRVNKYNKKRKAPPAPAKNVSKDDDTSRVKNQLLNDPKNVTLDNKPRIYTTNANRSLATQKQFQSPTMKVMPFKRDLYVRTSVVSPSKIQHSNSAYASKLPYRREKSFDAKLLRHNKQNDASDTHTSAENGKQNCLSANINKLEIIRTKEQRNLESSAATKKVLSSNLKKTDHSETDYNKDQRAKRKEQSVAAKPTTLLSLNRKTPNEHSAATNERKTKNLPQSRIPQLKRTFYFGMESASNEPNPSSTAPTLPASGKNKKPLEENTNLPELNHRIEEDEEILDNGIWVHIRPTLPRRQLEAPSFSPVAAWRNLLEKQQCLQLERCKVKQNSAEHRLVETPICLQTTEKVNYASDSTQLDWTPQQDLKDDEEKEAPKSQNHINSLHVFSLSLPRDVHLQQQANNTRESNYQEKNLPSANCWLVPGFNSLQKFKTQFGKSTDFHSNTKCTCSAKTSHKHHSYQLENNFTDSFALESTRHHHLDCHVNKTFSKPARYQTDNWLLDKSNYKPLNNANEIFDDNCLKTSLNSLSFMNLQPKSLSNICTGKHIVYLPGQETFFTTTQDSYKHSNHPNKTTESNYKKQRQRQENVRENLQDLTPIQNIHQSNVNINEKNTHRFSFQSTVRVLEKRRLAEKLSKDAEVQEAQRLHELEAIKRVEEDFQRKRAPEKANLRNQLRLHFKATDEKTEYRSLPLNINEKIASQDAYNNQQISDANNNLFCRAEPDGAVSPTAELRGDLPQTRHSNLLLTTTNSAKHFNCLEYDGEESESETQVPNLQCTALLIEPYLNSII